MSHFVQQLRKYYRLHLLIRRCATGRVCDLADRFNVSEATIHRYVRELRSFGAIIDWCPVRQSYYYIEDFELSFDRLR